MLRLAESIANDINRHELIGGNADVAAQSQQLFSRSKFDNDAVALKFHFAHAGAFRIGGQPNVWVIGSVNAMARIPFADQASLSTETGAMLKALPDIGIFKLLAQADAAFPKFAAFTASLWNEAELSPRRRELVILLVARLTDCEYEWFQHEEVARICGISEPEISALKQLDLDGFESGEQAMLEFAMLTTERGSPSDQQLAAVREALSDREIIELQLVVAIYAGLAAIMIGLDLELDSASGASQLGSDSRGPRLGR